MMALGAVSAQAQTTSNGPYYAEPAWDQTLACTTTATCPRFIVLSNMNSEAVLDRETGLVWERSPLTTTYSWTGARFQCTSRTIGSTTGERRKGWRLPSVHELASLVDPNNTGGNPDLPPGNPFTNVQSNNYWSATTQPAFANAAWHVGFDDGVVTADDKSVFKFVWCVRGGMNADQY